MIRTFVTEFKGQDGLTRIYFCPGKNALGQPLAKAIITGAEYRFTSKSDGSIEYVILKTDDKDGKLAMKITNSDGTEQMKTFQTNLTFV